MASPRFAPRLDILPSAQRRLWDELGALPGAFVLWGGTALALHLGYRQSVDFDFFSDTPVDLTAMLAEVPFLCGATIQQREPRTLTCTVVRGAPVKLSFFVVPGTLKALRKPHLAPGNGVRIASLLDLAGMKAKVVQDRAEIKDYLDIDALISLGGIDLAHALSAARANYGSSFAPLPTLKALTYFGDGNLVGLPNAVRQRLVTAVRAVDLVRLPKLRRAGKRAKETER